MKKRSGRMFRREEVERFIAFFNFVMRTIANYRQRGKRVSRDRRI